MRNFPHSEWGLYVGLAGGRVKETPLRGMRKLMAIVAFAVGLSPVVLAAPASAQEYPPVSCSLSLSVSVGERGQTVLASTANCDSPFRANVTVIIELLSQPTFLTNALTDANGQFHNVPFVIPENATLGQHTVRASGPGVDEPDGVLTAPLTVVDRGVPITGGIRGGAEGAGRLAFTGSDSLPLLWLALILLTIGTALVLAARRRAEVRRRTAV